MWFLCGNLTHVLKFEKKKITKQIKIILSQDWVNLKKMQKFRTLLKKNNVLTWWYNLLKAGWGVGILGVALVISNEACSQQDVVEFANGEIRIQSSAKVKFLIRHFKKYYTKTVPGQSLPWKYSNVKVKKGKKCSELNVIYNYIYYIYVIFVIIHNYQSNALYIYWKLAPPFLVVGADKSNNRRDPRMTSTILWV